MAPAAQAGEEKREVNTFQWPLNGAGKLHVILFHSNKYIHCATNSWGGGGLPYKKDGGAGRTFQGFTFVDWYRLGCFNIKWPPEIDRNCVRLCSFLFVIFQKKENFWYFLGEKINLGRTH